jgi:hypothetical protein
MKPSIILASTARDRLAVTAASAVCMEIYDLRTQKFVLEIYALRPHSIQHCAENLRARQQNTFFRTEREIVFKENARRVNRTKSPRVLKDSSCCNPYTLLKVKQ